MHELGVIFYVVRDVKKVAEENNVKKISAVTLEIGEVTGIIHDYLIDCWNWARKKEPVTEEAELKIEQIDAVTFCEDCGQEYPTVAHGRTCPHCGSEHTYLRRGNEFLIKEIESDIRREGKVALFPLFVRLFNPPISTISPLSHPRICAIVKQIRRTYKHDELEKTYSTHRCQSPGRICHGMPE